MFFHAVQKLGIEFIEDQLILVPQFEAVYLDENLGLLALRWLFMMYGYLSPYHNLPERERSDVVSKALYKKKEIGFLNNEKIIAAIKALNELQYDSDFDVYYSVDEQVRSLSQFIHAAKATVKEIYKIKSATSTLSELIDLKNKLKSSLINKIKTDEKDPLARGGKDFSFAENRFRKKDIVKQEDENNQM